MQVICNKNFVHNVIEIYRELQKLKDDNYCCILCYTHLDIDLNLYNSIKNKYIIVYNLEHINPNYIYENKENTLFYENISNEIWCHTFEGCQYLQQKYKDKIVKYKGILYNEDVISNNIDNENCDIDLLFYGWLKSQNNTRLPFLNELKRINNGKYNIKILENVFGEELDYYIKRSKIILNIHQYDNFDSLETTRIRYLVMNNKCVLSQHSKNDMYMKDCIKFFNYTPQNCYKEMEELLQNNNWYNFAKNIRETFLNLSNELKLMEK